jgi:hypothetical protein
MSFLVFCLRTSKGLSVGEFDHTKIHRISDSDFACILSFYCCFALLFLCFLMFSGFYNNRSLNREKERKRSENGRKPRNSAFCTYGTHRGGRHGVSHDVATSQDHSSTAKTHDPHSIIPCRDHGGRHRPVAGATRPKSVTSTF